MNKQLYEIEILKAQIQESENKQSIDKRYSKLNTVMQSMYDFVLAYSHYYSIRRDYGSGEKFTMIEIHILTEIADSSGITVTQLAEKWCRTPSAISQIVRRLMKWGLINRVNNEKNGKIYNLTVTKKGADLVLLHKKYDNLDIIKTRKKLLKQFSIEELISFDKICKEYTNLLRSKQEIIKK